MSKSKSVIKIFFGLSIVSLSVHAATSVGLSPEEMGTAGGPSASSGPDNAVWGKLSQEGHGGCAALSCAEEEKNCEEQGRGGRARPGYERPGSQENSAGTKRPRHPAASRSGVDETSSEEDTVSSEEELSDEDVAVRRASKIRFSELEDKFIRDWGGDMEWGELGNELNLNFHEGKKIRRSGSCYNHWAKILCRDDPDLRRVVEERSQKRKEERRQQELWQQRNEALRQQELRQKRKEERRKEALRQQRKEALRKQELRQKRQEKARAAAAKSLRSSFLPVEDEFIREFMAGPDGGLVYINWQALATALNLKFHKGADIRKVRSCFDRWNFFLCPEAAENRAKLRLKVPAPAGTPAE